MESCGIEVFLFHPLFKSLWYQPFRDHRKILVVDREVAFTGGMNIGEEYGSWRRRPKPGETWRDTHVRVAGPAAWEMAVVFSEGWVHAGGEPFEIDPLPAEAAEAPGVRTLVLDSRPKRGQAEAAAVMERAFLTDLESALEISREDWRRRSWLKKLGDRMARWLSPLL